MGMRTILQKCYHKDQEVTMIQVFIRPGKQRITGGYYCPDYHQIRRMVR